MRHLSIVLAATLVTACASSPKQESKQSQDIQPDIILSRIDDLKERPSDIRESTPFKIENGQVQSLGMTSIPGDNRVEAAYRIADNSAKGLIATTIEQRLEFIFQNAEEGTGLDAQQARFIGAEASKLTTSSIRISKHYWEKVASTNEGGQRVIRFKVYSVATMPEADFKSAIMEAIKKQQGKGGLSQDFAKKVNSHWDDFVNGGSQQGPNATTEANQSK